MKVKKKNSLLEVGYILHLERDALKPCNETSFTIYSLLMTVSITQTRCEFGNVSQLEWGCPLPFWCAVAFFVSANFCINDHLCNISPTPPAVP